MTLIAIIVAILFGAGGLGVRIFLTRMLPRTLTRKLGQYQEMDRERYHKLFQFLMRPDLGKILAAVAAAAGAIPLLLLGMKIGFLPLLGYVAGVVNWKGLIAAKFDLKYFLADEIKLYRSAVIEAHLEENNKKSDHTLRNALKRLPPADRDLAYGQIVEMDTPRIVPWLIQVLTLPADAEVKKRAFLALKEKDPKEFRDMLPQFTRSSEPAVRALAVDHLDLLKPTVARHLIKERKEDEDQQVRSKAKAEWQVAISQRELDWLDDLMTKVQGQPYRKELGELRKELTSGSWQSIQAAREAMGTNQEWKEIEPLLKIMQSLTGSPPLVAIIQVLQTRDDREAVLAIKNLLSQPDEAPDDDVVQEVAINALGNMESLTAHMIGESLKSASLKEQEAMTRVLGSYDPKVSIQFLKRSLNEGGPHLRKASVKSLTQLPTDSTILGLLRGRFADNDVGVRVAAYEALAEVGDMEILTELIQRHQQMGMVKGAFNPANIKYVEKKALGEAIRTLIARIPLYSAPPDEVVCLIHRTRGVLKKEESWQYPVCRRCGEVNTLVHGVRSLRGVIGPVKPGFVKEGHYEVPLWDEVKKKPLYGDISVLEVRAGADIEYDWAVSAVLETLRNDDRFQDQVIPVEISGDPVLHPNTLRLLTEITGDEFPLKRNRK